MSIFNRVTYSRHALRRMQKRHVSPEEVVIALRFGEGHFDEGDGTWTYEFAWLAVVITERGSTAHIVTVIRKRKHT